LYFFILLICSHPRSPLFPYTTLFRSVISCSVEISNEPPVYKNGVSKVIVTHPIVAGILKLLSVKTIVWVANIVGHSLAIVPARRSEEHTSELQSRENLVCRLLLEKKN